MQRKLLRLMAVVVVTCWLSGRAEAQSVSLDQVDGLQGIDTIVSGQEIVLHFRYTTTDTLYAAMNNGFRIYSPDGGEWTTVSGAWSEFVTAEMFPRQFVVPRSVTGTGADSIGFAGFLWTGHEGIPPGFDSVAIRITIGPIDAGFEGKTVCIDSAFYPPGNHWKWVTFRGSLTPVYPSWDGPHCFTVASPASCCALRGDVDNNDFGPDIGDLIYLIEYVNEGGPAPPCMEQADVNGSGGDADADDLDYLMAYMFSGGPPPVPCP